ncbi:MAG: hypothetical protein GY769_17625 [bacterium]|nr:hypothetical protein [bacterium]
MATTKTIASTERVRDMLEALEAARTEAGRHYHAVERGHLDLELPVAGRVTELLDEAVGLYEAAYQKLAKQTEREGF